MQEDYANAIKNLEKALRLADTDEVKNIVYFKVNKQSVFYFV